MPLIATAELTGGILLITNKYRALGALILLPVMVGIIVFHITTAPSGLPLVLVLLAIIIWVIYENREKYFPLVR
jgi:hypothetical protein